MSSSTAIGWRQPNSFSEAATFATAAAFLGGFSTRRLPFNLSHR